LKRAAGRAPDRIRWMGVAKEDKWSLLRGLDLGLCLYRPELLRLKMAATASNKMFECLAAGCPVLTSPEPDFVSFLKENPVGLAVPELSVAGIRTALVEIFADEPRRKQLSATARALHETRFHFEFQFEGALGDIRKRFPSTS